MILDVTAMPRVEPAGAAEWRGFMQMISPLVEQILILGVQPALLEKVCNKDDLGAKGVVLDIVLPYTCNSCGTSSAQSIDVAEHHDVLKFATAPEQRCPSCKAAMQCTASEPTMTVLPGLPKPAITKELERQIGMLKARKVDKRPSTGIVAIPKLPGGTQSKTVPILLAAVLLVLVAAGVVFFMKSSKEREPGPYGAGPVVERSTPQRPAWITAAATPGAAYCSDDGGGIACVGVSTLSPSQQDAEDEASDAAVEAIAFELSKRVTDKAWLASVPAMFLSARDAKLAAINRDLQSTQARRDVRDGRRAVAHALRGVESNAAGRYWEAFDARDGRRHVAFVQVKLGGGDAMKLIASYTKRETIAGATIVSFFPGLAWKFPKHDHGAVVVALEPGEIQQLGVAEKYIVLAVDGRDVVDASSFVKILGEEHASLAERGGSLRLLVQGDTGDPREFSTQIAGKPVEGGTPIPNNGRNTGRNTGSGGTGGVNVWDRFGGNKGSGRDDPTQ